MRTRAVKLLVLAGVIALLAACGGGGDAGDDDAGDGEQPAADGIMVSMTEYAFDPETIEIDADTPVTITAVNDGIIEHDWTIDELSVQIAADAGESATGTVTAPAGTYEVYCSIPGHRDAGMVGELVVS